MLSGLGQDSNKAYAAENDLKNEELLQSEPLANDSILTRHFMSVTVYAVQSPGNLYYHEKVMYGQPMGGWLSLVNIPRPGVYIYEGYLYNLNYPVPIPSKIKPEEQ